MWMSVTVFLCLVWALSLLYGEMFAFWLPSLSSWPHHSSPMNGVEYPGAYVKVAVIADPQLMDKTSHNFGPKSLILEIVEFYTDLFMRRAFLASISPMEPHVILFLGDYFDGGMFLPDEEWEESLSRLKHIFELNSLERSKNAQVYHLPGNHDIGYAAFHRHMPQVIRRYEKVFGRRNYQFTLGEVDFIAIDAQTLDGHPQGNLTLETWNFIKNVARDDSSLRPRVLLSHIPLYRPDWTSCGPRRSSPVINQRVSRATSDGEILYQNYVSEEATNKLLESVRPVLILSGHDHDQCTVTHMTTYGPVREHTVGTISWQQGNIYPSYLLLSASNHTSTGINNVSSHDDSAVLTQLCFLPVQLFIYLWYLFLFFMTLLLALLWPTLGFSFQVGNFMGYITSIIGTGSNIFSGGGMKEKNEDDNCEYEMVWDAEGSMHLIKKAFKATTTTASTEKGTVERGNVVMRSTAKKQIVVQQEIDVSMPLDVNISVGGSDTMSKLGPLLLLPRANKSKTKIAIRRMVRLLQVLTIVAAVNLPLYMMLLFKDWIDN